MFNIDSQTVSSFGAEWERFDQSALSEVEYDKMFDAYFGIFPFGDLPDDAEGFDMGCGSGRWARGTALRVGHLHCIDPALSALAVARRNLATAGNVTFHHSGANDETLPEGSQDFGYSLGVLHHIPNTEVALGACIRMLKPGAPFLVYLYYRFDNRPAWFRALWKASELFRGTVSCMPDRVKPVATDILAGTIYWPLARSAKLAERLGIDPTPLPLSHYRNHSFYTMRTDSRDRFGTPLEQRFTRAEIKAMMVRCGLTDIRFSEHEPFWVACGRKG